MDMAQVIIKGDAQALKAAHKAIIIALGVVQNEHACIYEWDNLGYLDDVGGHHDSGCGWAPDGSYCGICSHQSCRECSLWKHKQQRKRNP